MRLYCFIVALGITTVVVLAGRTAVAQPIADNTSPPIAPPSKKWYENIGVKGYIQMRYNRLLETNPKLGCEQCDASWGENGGFFIRRARITFYGQISKRVYFYLQPDFATSAGGERLNYLQLRDAYFDLGLDDENEFRFRLGQSKVPFGFENVQSSSNRLALDRSDALNSAVFNERDQGVFFFYTPKEKRELYKELVSSGLKGSGDYGVLALGVYNGQTANRPELNNQPHVVARFNYPFEYKGQIIEAGVSAYTGKYVLSPTSLSTDVKYLADRSYTDRRAAASFVLYPKPIGFQAEYNVGQGPEFNKLTDSIEVRNLKGGYVQMMYSVPLKNQLLFPFVRYQYYQGGKKQERDARNYTVNDVEVGLEWQPYKSFELNATYTISHRRYEDFTLPNNDLTGRLLRLQAQVNF